MEKKHRYDVLGIGAPFVDHLLHVSEQYLDEIPGEKHGRGAVDYPEMIQLIKKSGRVPREAAGGSCANTIKGLASLGRKCAITGKIGSDAEGEIVLRDLQDHDVTPFFHYSSTPTGHVLSLITPDGKRTCRTYLGACQEMGPEDLDPAHFEGVKLVHIEGYSLLNKDLTQQAMQLAKDQGAWISFDLSSFEIVKQYKNTILDLLKNYVDIVFCNKDEAFALTGRGPKEGCELLKQLCEIAVVMVGKDGSWVGRGNETCLCPSFPIEEPIDTTGAGDLFASGFLHSFLAGKSIKECGKWGAITASSVVQVVGAEIPPETWQQIKARLS